MKEIILIGAIGNPNVGDEAILYTSLKKIADLYGQSVKVHIFSKDCTYTLENIKNLNLNVNVIDYLHKISLESFYDGQLIREKHTKLLAYTLGGLEYNYKFDYIHQIFKNADRLQIIGGGYLSSKWPDMLLEIETSIKLAQKYSLPYAFTGISTDLFNLDDLSRFQELIQGATYVDLRTMSSEFGEANNIIHTTDEVITLRENPVFTRGNDKYINLMFHKWDDDLDLLENKIKEVLVPYIQTLLEKNDVDYINILAFSEGDLDFSNIYLEGLPNNLQERINIISCLPYNAEKIKALIGYAFLNIGTRFHHAVFSLSSDVPMLSFYYGEYYKNKVQSIHEVYNSESFYALEDMSKEVIEDFFRKREYIIETIQSMKSHIQMLVNKKNKYLAEFYDCMYQEDANLSNIKVSVIVPVYNTAPYIKECLDSITKQTLCELEVICIDDGSIDSSFEILNELASKDERIRVITQKNSGVAKARNRALGLAKGKYVFFLDSDDWLSDEKVLEDLYMNAEEYHVNVCGGSFQEMSGNVLITEWAGNNTKYTFKENRLMDYKDFQFDYGWVRFLYNRAFLINNELEIPIRKFYEDPVFFVSVMAKAKVFMSLKRPVYTYRTGHHDWDLDFNKLIDLASGMRDIIKIASENGYDDLINLELYRLKHDYRMNFINHLGNEGLPKLLTIFNEIEEYAGLEKHSLITFILVRNHEFNAWKLWEASNNSKILKKIKSIIKRILPNPVVRIIKKGLNR